MREEVPSTADGQPTLAALREEAAVCKACPLWKTGTQTVFGEGSHDARIMLVGEQPGDEEDQVGRPFVGPAGQLLDRALAAAGLDRGAVYVTNTVKHFKWEPRGKRRVHQKPNAREIAACLPWLDAEIDVVRPQVIALLGATAAQALLGPGLSRHQNAGKMDRIPARTSCDRDGASLVNPARARQRDT